MSICRVCGRTGLVEISVKRIDGAGTEAKFSLCNSHTFLADYGEKLGRDRALREGARVGEVFVEALSKAGEE